MGGTPGPSERPLRPEQEPGGPVTQPPGSEAASGPKPSLRDRLQALQDKHGHGEPVRTEDDQQADAALATPPATMEEAAANVEAVFGDAIVWAREFGTHTREDGTTLWVDKATGAMYDQMPRLDSKDGTNL